MNLANRELCHSTSKPICDEEDILKSFIGFNIIPCGPVFRVAVGSQIVVPPTIPPSQWHSRDSNPWSWLWYHLSDRELCHSTSKPIGDEEDILKSFMGFNITPCGLVFRVAVGSQIAVPPTIPPSQWHSRDSNPWSWLWYHLSDRELCHSTSKPISDEEDILKSFMGFNITDHTMWDCF